jgi:hypothetical protein
MKLAISNTIIVILLLDTMEEYRTRHLKNGISNICYNNTLIPFFIDKKNSLEERGTIKWVKFGYASTNFFHSRATLKHKTKYSNHHY